MRGGLRQRPDGWTVVRRHQGGRKMYPWDSFPPSFNLKRGREENVVSFYFSALTDRYTAKEFFELFGCIGEVVEVSISPRRNKFGKKFGFARFVEVEDARLLVVKLDNVIVKGKKIHANIPRFDRIKDREAAFQYRGRGNFGAVEIKSRDRGFGRFNNRREGLSYAGAVAGVVGASVSASAPLASSAQPSVLLRHVTSEEDRNRFANAMVGEILIAGSAHRIQTMMDVVGFHAIKMSVLGPNLCLLEETEQGALGILLEEGVSNWKCWFSAIRKWTPDVVDSERTIKIRVFGIPCFAWNNDFLMSLANSLGTFICLDSRTSEGSYFEFARITLKVKFDFASQQSVLIDIDGVPFTLLVLEELECHSFPSVSIASSNSNSESWSSDFVDLEEAWSDDSKGNREDNVKVSDSDPIEEFSSRHSLAGSNISCSASGQSDSVVKNSVLEPCSPLDSVQPELGRYDRALIAAKSKDLSLVSDGNALSGSVPLEREIAQSTAMSDAGFFQGRVCSVAGGGSLVGAGQDKVSTHKRLAVSCTGHVGNSFLLDNCGNREVNSVLKSKKIKLKRISELGSVKFLVATNKFRKIKRKGTLQQCSCSDLLAVSSGKTEMCYGDHAENSVISRNNKKQWELVEDERGGKLKESIIALGVVGREEANSKVVPTTVGGEEKTNRFL
ncbi:uncharacterized protein LOC131619263 [Vicia villosa]|uniref:uncharacterized protein LOC131619263 n=1 Tax=Vicia villosa TaxID=3911 RepID=UPI00273B2E09|nr:uncharacterized protein LOC131619263 [Vicia villosa]